MPVVKLNSEHAKGVRHLFDSDKYMGVKIKGNFAANPDKFNELLYNIYCSNYLSNLKSFHSFGYVDDDGQVQALISFYESTEEPAWYYTVYRSNGNNKLLCSVLDSVISYNESNNRYKFYTLVHSRHSKLLRKFHWSKFNNNRYDHIDEYVVPAKTKCVYSNAWELLFKRILLPEDSIVRCNYLKQEFRDTLPIGGNI